MEGVWIGGRAGRADRSEGEKKNGSCGEQKRLGTRDRGHGQRGSEARGGVEGERRGGSSRKLGRW